MRSATLASYGWLDWSDARELLANAEGTWLDSPGIKTATGDWPDQLPLASVIHAWAPAGVLTRLVPDHARNLVLVVMLVPEGAQPPGSPTARRDVAPTKSEANGWVRYVVQGSSALTFVMPAASTPEPAAQAVPSQ